MEFSMHKECVGIEPATTETDRIRSEHLVSAATAERYVRIIKMYQLKWKWLLRMESSLYKYSIETRN